MTKYVFLNAPAYGHVNPTLAVVQELVRRGEQVVYYITEEFREAVEAAGAVCRPYQSLISKMQPATGPQTNPGAGPQMLPMMLAKECSAVLPQVLESIRADQPDCILYDGMCLWGRIASHVLQVPTILLRPSYVSNEHFSLFSASSAATGAATFPVPRAMFEEMQGAITELFAEYGLPPFEMRSFFRYNEALNIVFLPQAFQPAGETFDERFVFVGPSIVPDRDTVAFPFERLDGSPLLYISLGTVFNNRLDFFHLCFEAFGDQPWQVVLGYGKRIDETTLGTVPANFLLSPYVPQLAILQKADVFVTHGGMNSTMESLYYGVPLVVIPQMIEQAMTARRVEELGLGVALTENDLAVEPLRAAVTRVQSDSAFRERIQVMQETTRAAGGYKRAADAIINFAHAATEHSRLPGS